MLSSVMPTRVTERCGSFLFAANSKVSVSVTLRFVVRRPDLHVHSLEGVPRVPEGSPVDAVLEHSVITRGGRELVRLSEEARRRTGKSAVATGGDVPVRGDSRLDLYLVSVRLVGFGIFLIPVHN